MKKYYSTDLSSVAIHALTRRAAQNHDAIRPLVSSIIAAVKTGGDSALNEYSKQFDGLDCENYLVSAAEIQTARATAAPEAINAMTVAIANIERFHKLTGLHGFAIETLPGVRCSAKVLPIANVGIYVPGGTAALPSTLLMLAVPAKLAGCQKIIVATPPDKTGSVNSAVLLAASFFDNIQLYKIGGAQAIAALAFGTATIPKIDKIFGPGNQFVTLAKMLVAQDPDGAAFDAPAGPSEVLVIADDYADPRFVAADLLAQAEHSVDAQAVLVVFSELFAELVEAELSRQLSTLKRSAITTAAMRNCFCLIVPSDRMAMEFANDYAPEHLVINTVNALKLAAQVTNAGSVFVGSHSCEAAGDYASGANHTLPTSGYARSYSGITLASFQKQIFIQQLSAAGARLLSPTVCTLADLEGLDAHSYSMSVRIENEQ
ncbi:MAG: histidinol dehydrogenase [Bacillota bacterium]